MISAIVVDFQTNSHCIIFRVQIYPQDLQQINSLE